MRKFKITRLVGLLYVGVAVAGISVLIVSGRDWSSVLWNQNQTQTEDTTQQYGKAASTQLNEEQTTTKVSESTSSTSGIEQESDVAKSEIEQTEEVDATDSQIEEGSEEILLTDADNVQDSDTTAEDTKTEVTETEATETEVIETEENVELVTQAGKSYKITITGASFVNVRESDVSKAKTVGVLSEGTTGVLVEAGKYCSLIQTNKLTGYVYNKYLTLEEM